MTDYWMNDEEKESYNKPSKRELDYLKNLKTDLNLKCQEEVYVNLGSQQLTNEDPALYNGQHLES